MPGDAAFLLVCNFVPEFSEIDAELSSKSKIVLVDADPSKKADPENENYVVSSVSDEVSFSPNTIPVQVKEEL